VGGQSATHVIGAGIGDQRRPEGAQKQGKNIQESATLGDLRGLKLEMGRVSKKFNKGSGGSFRQTPFPKKRQKPYFSSRGKDPWGSQRDATAQKQGHRAGVATRQLKKAYKLRHTETLQRGTLLNNQDKTTKKKQVFIMGPHA